MSHTHLAFVFPAFVRDYREDKSFQIPGFREHFASLLSAASKHIDPDLIRFDPDGEDFLDHELRTQYIAFIHGCAISEVIKRRGVEPDLLAGYSMGIYAALVQTGSISFSDGLTLIRHAFQEISYTSLSERFGMAGIIGMNEQDLLRILQDRFPGVMISNQNSAFSFVLSGRLNDLHNLMEVAREEGAFHARMLNVSIPYHSLFLQSAAIQFEKIVRQIPFHLPETPIISVLNQTLLTTTEQLRTEVVKNIWQHFNWFHTQQRLIESGIQVFIECGPGKSLKKNSRFIDGNYIFYSPEVFLKSLGQVV